MAHNNIRNIRKVDIHDDNLVYTYSFKDSGEELKDNITLSSLKEEHRKVIKGYVDKHSTILLKNYVQYLINLPKEELEETSN